ncbi:hypothetical protein RUM44_013224 [Polyplax serrata]|uniref:RRM domain-containing protein n=1 Tax=Polyplax serrata TaxID=468196 RepID=A0ABR1BDU9_POLSC
MDDQDKKIPESIDNSDFMNKYGVTLKDNKYTYVDSNGQTFVWDETKNSWEKKDAGSTSGELSDTDKTKSTPQYGFDGKHHTYTDPRDNTTYFWDNDKNAWFPKVDDDFLAMYNMSYGFVDNTTPAEPSQAQTSSNKQETDLKRKAPQQPCWFEEDEKYCTKVYVSNLPLDITEEEFVNLMQKCGLVMKDVNTHKWKVKLYMDKENNHFKGDALCTYIKKESVDLALSVLDEYEFKGSKISVQRAKFQMKGEYNPALKPKKKKRKEKEKEKKILDKLFEWKPEKLRGEREKHEKTVIIKNLFEPSIFDSHMELILEYTQDLREECSKCGVIRKLILHDKHPEGVAQVTFSDPEEADLCIKLLNNRWFGKRKITAEVWDGKTKYKIVENEKEEKERLDSWKKFLESEEQKEGDS